MEVLALWSGFLIGATGLPQLIGFKYSFLFFILPNLLLILAYDGQRLYKNGSS
jgi:hypothetical protein